ncbi:hypothetical protein [Candidatus Poriferisocius sp.]|uniref:hypothetical protein n=1 Tax=Candidatus Poriferisocius sp. TaxID=3101276 RepID=UPI003B523527
MVIRAPQDCAMRWALSLTDSRVMLAALMSFLNCLMDLGEGIGNLLDVSVMEVAVGEFLKELLDELCDGHG